MEPGGIAKNSNPYAVLGVKPHSTEEEIRERFKDLARQCHPDRGGCPHIFADLARSVEILSNPKLRAAYDAGGCAGVESCERANSRAQWEHNTAMCEALSGKPASARPGVGHGRIPTQGHPGGAAFTPAQQREQARQNAVNVGLNVAQDILMQNLGLAGAGNVGGIMSMADPTQAYNAFAMAMTGVGYEGVAGMAQRTRPMPPLDDSFVKCPTARAEARPTEQLIERELECTLLELYGGCVKQVCVALVRTEPRTNSAQLRECRFTIRIAAGYADGTRLAYDRKGNCWPGGTPGSITFVVKEKETPGSNFCRSGADLNVMHPIRLVDALCGTTLRLRHLDGSEVSAEVPPAHVLSSKSTVVVPGRGFPIPGATGAGNMIVWFKIAYPSAITGMTRGDTATLRSVLGDKATYPPTE